MDGIRRARGVLTAVAGTWTARVYLLLCCALLLWALADAAFVTREDASMAGIFPLLATAPLSLLLLLLPGDGLPVHVLVVVVSALVNAAVINRCASAVGRRGQGTGDAR